MAYDVRTRLRCSIPSKADLCLRVGVDEGMHFQVIIIAGTVRGPRFGPTPSQLWGRRLSVVIVQPIDAARPELSPPFEELPMLLFYFS